jgi:hypothetical protein
MEWIKHFKYSSHIIVVLFSRMIVDQIYELYWIAINRDTRVAKNNEFICTKFSLFYYIFSSISQIGFAILGGWVSFDFVKTQEVAKSWMLVFLVSNLAVIMKPLLTV